MSMIWSGVACIEVNFIPAVLAARPKPIQPQRAKVNQMQKPMWRCWAKHDFGWTALVLVTTNHKSQTTRYKHALRTSAPLMPNLQIDVAAAALRQDDQSHNSM